MRKWRTLVRNTCQTSGLNGLAATHLSPIGTFLPEGAHKLVLPNVLTSEAWMKTGRWESSGQEVLFDSQIFV